jgi:hypothetical protein
VSREKAKQAPPEKLTIDDLPNAADLFSMVDCVFGDCANARLLWQSVGHANPYRSLWQLTDDRLFRVEVAVIDPNMNPTHAAKDWALGPREGDGDTFAYSEHEVAALTAARAFLAALRSGELLF